MFNVRILTSVPDFFLETHCLSLSIKTGSDLYYGDVIENRKLQVQGT